MLHCNIGLRSYLLLKPPSGRYRIMSKQLAISAAVSIFAMVASVLALGPAANEAVAPAHAAAPAQVSLEAVTGLQAIRQ